ncbi:hypothetical protein [uncultured Paraglaciecola sp.]|uniref:hypothetical protein n=1 Tax=uncultured Paraglaciecola sp. TaxID=1765024 RepID=UPI00260688A2|nr:hypothetical protein [uncultured Paraglaciecola sp.]
MSDKISSRDIGTDLQVTFKEEGAIVDISAATAVEIELTKPDGTKVVRTASLLTDGTDGIAHYATTDGDRETSGGELQKKTWSYLGIATFSPIQKFHSIDPKEFEVV